MYRINCLIILILFSFLGCRDDYRISSGSYIGNLYTSDNLEIPFNLYILNYGLVQIYNHKQIVEMEKISYEKDSFLIKSPVFEGYFKGKKSVDGMEGYFINKSLKRKTKFKASLGHERFKSKFDKVSYNFLGEWKIVFNIGQLDEYQAIGLFSQEDSKVSGTVRTKTGDYGFLEGISEDNRIILSTFNGAYSYLFKGEVNNDTIKGFIYSGNYSKKPFIAYKDKDFYLPDPNSLTEMNDQSDDFEFSFEDSSGVIISDKDSIFKDKVVVVQIMGTWCPNCLDETVFISEFLNRNDYNDLRVVSLAFEYAKTKQEAINNINKLKERFNIKYPVLLAQYGTSNKDEAQKKIPSIKQVISYPTLIFIDRNKKVRSIHTGFNGPATGKKYEEFKKKFQKLISELIDEV